MWQTVLDRVLRGFITRGTLRITYPDGTARTYGDATQPEAHITLHDPALMARLVRNPEMAFGEGYMNGTLTVDEGGLESAMRIAIRCAASGSLPLLQQIQDWAGYLLRPILQRNSVRSARRNVAHHYDLSDDFYRLMLDPDMQYSCAYFQQPWMTLEQAQAAKKAHIARKLCLEPGMRVLDIGCGWGEALKYAAERYGISAVGITISREQAAYARELCAGLPVEIRQQDYRDLDEPFDAAFSLGMFEHVGVRNYATYFGVVRRCLPPHGLFLLHTIGTNRSVNRTDPWIARYIFPNSMLPSAAQIARAFDGSFVLEDWHGFGTDYDRTLQAWRDNIEAAWPALDPVRYDERFRRMWRFYLAASMATFRSRRSQLWQLVLSPQGVPEGYEAPR